MIYNRKKQIEQYILLTEILSSMPVFPIRGERRDMWKQIIDVMQNGHFCYPEADYIRFVLTTLERIRRGPIYQRLPPSRQIALNVAIRWVNDFILSYLKGSERRRFSSETPEKRLKDYRIINAILDGRKSEEIDEDEDDYVSYDGGSTSYIMIFIAFSPLILLFLLHYLK
jgi:hypothetical protein